MNLTKQMSRLTNKAWEVSRDLAKLATVESNACLLAMAMALMVAPLVSQAVELRWQHLSSATGDLPAPGTSTQQTGAIVADFANDGINGFVLSFRQKAPALVWYRRAANGWDRYIIESDFLTVEAGGVVCDVDGDGHPDIIFGGDWQSDEVWWWENPYPNFDPKVSWKRHLIKKGGATQHHDQVIGDFLGTGKPQLAFWNQGDKAIYPGRDSRRSAPRKFVAFD